MLICHERRIDPSASLAGWVADRGAYEQVVALYDLQVVCGEKPVVVVSIDRHADLSGVSQGSAVLVRGWPEVGRAVVLDIGDTIVEPAYPCTSPVMRSMRWK